MFVSKPSPATGWVQRGNHTPELVYIVMQVGVIGPQFRPVFTTLFICRTEAGYLLVLRMFPMIDGDLLFSSTRLA